MALLMDLSVVFAALNSLLLAGLIYMYGRTAFRSHAAFPLGLLLFAALLLMHDAMTVYSYFSMSAYFGAGVLPFIFLATVLESAGLIILFRITL